MSKLLDRLRKLYALACVDPDEKSEARLNEARTAAFLLIKHAREGGVKIRFEVPKEREEEPSASGNWAYPSRAAQDDLLEGIRRAVERAREAERRSGRSPFAPKAEPENEVPFQARRAGACTKCGRQYRLGDRVVRRGPFICHVDCEEGEPELEVDLPAW